MSDFSVEFAENDQQITLTLDQIGGGGGGTSDYSDLSNKPQINGVTLAGNLTTAQIGITIPDVSNLQTKAITDAGGYFTTDTVEAALQQLGATVDGIETLLAAI